MLGHQLFLLFALLATISKYLASSKTTGSTISMANILEIVSTFKDLSSRSIGIFNFNKLFIINIKIFTFKINYICDWTYSELLRLSLRKFLVKKDDDDEEDGNTVLIWFNKLFWLFMIWDFPGPNVDLNCPKLDANATLGFLVSLIRSPSK